MSLKQLSVSTDEPVTLAEAKLHLRVETDDDDTLIASLITAARQGAETMTQRQLMTARWRLYLDSFPAGQMFAPFGAAFSIPQTAILLHKPPLQSVDSINYLDMSGAQQTLDSSKYTVDLSCEPARITPIFGTVWPPTLPQINAVWVDFTAGYADASSVPDGIKAWIKIRVGSLYMHREEVAILPRGKMEELPFVNTLLDPYRVVTM